jgi:GSH-dependent disulfide-bond oxidoreductase
MLELYTSEPNTFFLKPLIALHEKRASFDTHWFDSDELQQFGQHFPGEVEAQLHLEREGPLLRHDGTLISNSFFMLEYIAEALPGEKLLPDAPYDLYRAHASGQFLGAHLGSLVPVLGCARYLAPRLMARDRTALDAQLAQVNPQERRLAWQALVDGTYTPQILATARERLKVPVSRVESQLAQDPWLAGSHYSIADIDAFAMLRVLPDLAPEICNPGATPRVIDYLARIEARPAVRAALATSRSGRPHQHFVPGVEPSRWG